MAETFCFLIIPILSLLYQQDTGLAAAESKRLTRLGGFLVGFGHRFLNKKSQKNHLIIFTVKENYCTT